MRNECNQLINLKGWTFFGNGKIKNDIRKDLKVKNGTEVTIDMTNYIFDFTIPKKSPTL